MNVAVLTAKKRGSDLYLIQILAGRIVKKNNRGDCNDLSAYHVSCNNATPTKMK